MLSVLIVNWNTKSMLQSCLQSIKTFPPNEKYEVIVVDNSSTDDSAAMVKENFPDVTLIENPTNTGYANGNNLAFAKAKGNWLLTLNPDTEVRESTLQAAIDTLEKHPEHGCLGIKQIGSDGRVQSSIRGFPSLIGIFGMLTKLDKLFPNSKLGSYRLPNFDYEKEQDAPQPMGTFILFREQALIDAGCREKPFDEDFPIFFNEVDLLYRLKKASWPALYTPHVEILHHGGESTKQVKKSMIWESHRSLVRFLQKHFRTPWNAIGLTFLSWAILAAAFIRAKGYHVGFRT